MGMVFIGGGQAARILLDMFRNNQEYQVVGVVDPNPEAEGVKRAITLGVKTGKDMGPMIESCDVQVIVELTGNDKVRQMALEKIRPDQNVIAAGGARILVDMVQRQMKYQDMFRELMTSIRSSIGEIDKNADQTHSVLSEFKMLALNAQIVASQVGREEAVFDAVVSHMKTLIETIEGLVSDIRAMFDESANALYLLKNAQV